VSPAHDVPGVFSRSLDLCSRIRFQILYEYFRPFKQQQAHHDVQTYEADADHCVSDPQSRSTCRRCPPGEARLIAQVYEVDPMVFPRCSAPRRSVSRAKGRELTSLHASGRRPPTRGGRSCRRRNRPNARSPSRFGSLLSYPRGQSSLFQPCRRKERRSP